MDDTPQPAATRLVSLDIFRGLIMFLLVAETAQVYHAFGELAPEGAFGHALITQFHHHEWHGLRFWDLVQPFFMFIVGVAMAFSMAKRTESGHGWGQSLRHILYRCAMLLMFGVGLHCIYARGLRWELWNVLSQLSVTILIAFLIMRWLATAQIAVSVALILFTEIAYRAWPIEGYDQPFVKGENFGSWMDMLLMGKINGGGWVAISCIPTAAHTIWGVVAGQLLLGDRRPALKIGTLVLWGAFLLAVGYGLDGQGVTPIIKRICTSSFVIVSGGWCLVVLAILYWLVDIVGLKRWGFLFVVVGMNPIFIYLFSESIGRQWLNDTVAIFTDGALKPLGTSESVLGVVAALTVLALEWRLCYWLYKRKILIKI
ncbi:DUF5009 domain-containing protein [Pirellulales bacterium]|nr:DUF5009 domain-containing protein [Pirellulales bacterium]